VKRKLTRESEEANHDRSERKRVRERERERERGPLKELKERVTPTSSERESNPPQQRYAPWRPKPVGTPLLVHYFSQNFGIRPSNAGWIGVVYAVYIRGKKPQSLLPPAGQTPDPPNPAVLANCINTSNKYNLNPPGLAGGVLQGHECVL